MSQTRRNFLRSVGGAGAVGLAGCTGRENSSQTDGSEDDGVQPATDDGKTQDSSDRPRPPTASHSLYLGHEPEAIRSEIVSGGVPQDGIPSIDEPNFWTADEAPLDPNDPVFGAVRDGEAKAYPQKILVQHEIVNDTLGGDPVAVTYCPLTGTAQGFERGDVEFGVSGNLVNSNLVMYDRSISSWWPQILATAVTGEMAGKSLQEFRVVWTTWERWRATYSETDVLSDNTGFSRRYSASGDPYGQYNPTRGYYTSDRTIFPPLIEDDRNHPKTVVIGTRTTDGALAFDKETLLEKRVLTGTIAETPYVAVAEQDLATGYVYANPDGATIEAVGGGYKVDGDTFGAADLPLSRALAFDGMWFAWAGFYPEIGYVD